MLIVLWGIAWITAFPLVVAFDMAWWQPAAIWLSFEGIVARHAVTGGLRAGRKAFAGSVGVHLIGAATAGMALLGGLRAQSAAGPPPGLADFLGQSVTVTGVVDSEPKLGLGATTVRVSVQSLGTGDTLKHTDGRLLASLGEYERIAPGTRLRLTGKLVRPQAFEDFDYAKYLLAQRVVGTMYKPQVEVLSEPSWTNPKPLVMRIRDGLSLGLARSLPEPEAALAAGLLIGRDDGLPKDVKDAFRETGLAHITAVSGANVVVITAIVFAVSGGFLKRRTAVIPAAVAVLLYVLLAGAAWSIVRAAAMAGVYLLGEQLRRPRSGLSALLAVSVGITAIRPEAAVDVGFQLSAMATAGLIVFGPWVRFIFSAALGSVGRAVVPRTLVEVAALTVSATVATLPVSWAKFGTLSLVSPFANIVAEPLFAVSFVGAGITGPAAIVSEQLGWGVGLAEYYPLHLMIITAETLAGWPMATVELGEVDPRTAILSCALLGLAGWPCYRFLPPDLPAAAPLGFVRPVRKAAVALGAVALGIAVFRWSLAPLGGPGEVRVVALDIGQGDAILVRTPHGRDVLIDGGPSGLALTQQLGRALPHWARSVDVVIVTHPQLDHFAGLVRLFRTYRVGRVLDTGAKSANAPYAEFERFAPAQRNTVAAGSGFEVDGVTFTVLWPPPGTDGRDVNESSLVLRVSYAGFTALLTGDIEGQAIADLASTADLRADILKVPHHGSATTPGWFFSRVDADAAVISVGAGNRYGHPAPGTLDSLAGVPLARTDLDGRITVAFGARGIRVWSQRGEPLSLPVGTGRGYGGTKQEGRYDPEARRPQQSKPEASEADRQRVGLRRRELPRGVRQNARPLRCLRRRPAARVAAEYGQRLGHGRIQHAPEGDPHEVPT